MVTLVITTITPITYRKRTCLSKRTPYPAFTKRKTTAVKDDVASTKTGWPVLYLLHDHHGDQNSWGEFGNIEKTLDTLIEAGAIRPAGDHHAGHQKSWYVDSSAVGGFRRLRNGPDR